MMHFLKSPWVLALIAPLSAVACKRPAVQHAEESSANAVIAAQNIAQYNLGTNLLKHDSLKAARVRLDSAMASRDSLIRYRSAFNGGWVRIVNAKRISAIINKGGSKLDSLMKVIAYDTAAMRVLELQPMHDKALPEVSRNVVGNYVFAEMDSARAKYRTALELNPNDEDARWNYEMGLYSTTGGGRPSKPRGNATDRGGKGESHGGGGGKGLRLPPQQAEQILNAMGAHEQRAAKDAPVLVAPPPQGKDW